MEAHIEIKVLGPLVISRFVEGEWRPVRLGGWEPPALLAILASSDAEISRDELFHRVKGSHADAGDSGDPSTYEWTRSLRQALQDDRANTIFPRNRRRTMHLQREGGVKVDYDEFKDLREDGRHQAALDLVRGDYAENLLRVDLVDIREVLLEEINESRIALGLPRVDAARRAKAAYGGTKRRGVSNPQLRQLFAPKPGEATTERIVARYRLHITDASLDPHHIAAELAATTGIGSAIDLPWFEPRSTPVITSITDLGHSQHLVEIGYPLEALSGGLNVPHLLTMLTLPAEYALTRYMWLDDVQFPPALLGFCQGPRHGVDGLRTKLGIVDRPIVSAIIKPRYAFVSSHLRQALSDVLTAGIDGIVDDELLVDPPGDLSFQLRLDLITDLVGNHEDPKFYIPNITGAHDESISMLEHVKAHELPAVTINPFTMGYGSFQSIVAAAGDLDVAVVDCSVGAGLVSRPDAYSGISRALLAKLSRLVGADAVHSGSEGEHWHSERLLRTIRTNLVAPLGSGVRPSLPVIAGGVNVANVWRKLSAFGSDCMANVGGGIWAFPGGHAAGAEGLSSIIREISLDVEAEEAQERLDELSSRSVTLREALRLLGV